MLKKYELTAGEIKKLKTIKGQEFRTMVIAKIIGIEKDLTAMMKCLDCISERVTWTEGRKKAHERVTVAWREEKLKREAKDGE